MELTKKDQRQIDNETDVLMRKIEVEASDYAHLYEQTFLRTLAEKIQMRIEASDQVVEFMKKGGSQ